MTDSFASIFKLSNPYTLDVGPNLNSRSFRGLLLPGLISVIIRKNVGKNYRKGFSSIPESLDEVIYLIFFEDKMIEEYEQDVLNALKKKYDISEVDGSGIKNNSFGFR